MACINNIKIKKVFDKPPGFISFTVDVSDYKSINNFIIQISNDWITNVNDKSIFLKWGDLDSIGCELEIDSKNIAINLDTFSCFPIYYLKKDNIFFVTSFWADINSKKDLNEIDYVNLAIMKRFEYIPYNETLIKNVCRLSLMNCLKINYEINSITLITSRVNKKLDLKINPTDVICNIISKSYKRNKKILLPLSSGLDSRHLLACALKVTESKNIEAYTYTLVTNKVCFESIIAKELCIKNNIKWTNINIDNFRKYDYESWKWNGGLGGLNGGYAYLAINKFMKKKNKNDYLVLSGFVGDLLSGKFLREKNLTLNNCITKTSMNMPPFLRDSIYSQNQFQLKIIKWLELGNLHKLNNNEMLCIGKVQYLSFLWKCYSDNKINFLTPYVNNQFISSVFKISSQDHKNRRWQRNDINNLIYPFDKNKKYFFRSNNVAIVEGLKIDSKYGFNEVKRCNKNKFIRFIGNIYFSKIYRKIETKLLCHKPFEILVRYIFNYLPTYRILNVLANRSIK